MSTSSISSLLSSLGNTSSTDPLSQLLGTSNSSTSSAVPSALQDAVNAILNSATSTSGSGIDVQSTVNAILEAEAAPEQLLQQQEAVLNTQAAALQTLETQLESFQTSVNAVTDFTGAFGALTVTSTDNNVVSATAANGTAVGTHTVLVSSLATTAADYTATYNSATAAVPTGSFDLLVGTASGSNQPVTIPVDSTDGTSTLSGLADYINKQDLGVTASVITDASGARLALVSQTSGSAGQITLSNDTTSADYSKYFTSGSASLPTGSFDLQVGSHDAVTIPVDSADGTSTLNGLASYINQQNLGVTASLVTDTSGARLALIPQSSGADGVINISNDTTGSGDGMGFAASYDPANPPAGNGMGFIQALDSQGHPLGADASLTVDGVPASSSSNTVTGVIPGVTLTLSGTSSTPITIDVEPDLTQVATAINNFVSSYNTVIQNINSQNTYDTTTSAAGTLLGDAGLDVLQGQLLSGISSSITGNDGYVNLQSIGITMQDDGTLSVDSATLNNALQNDFTAVQKLFQSTSPAGVGQTLQTALTGLTDPTNGPLNLDITGINSELSDLNSQISDFQAHLQDEQQQLTAEYSQINTTLEQLPQLLAQINSQLDAINPPSKS